MKNLSLKKQHGVASLLTAVVLLTCITLVALFTSKTVLMETKMTADDYRITQASEAAQAAMDQATAYFVAGGLDQMANSSTPPHSIIGADNLEDYTSPSLAQMPSATNCAMPATTPAYPLTLKAGNQTTFAQFYFVNTATFDNDNNPATAAIKNPCDNKLASVLTANPKDKALIVAKGWSDDCTAVRTITQCASSSNILRINPVSGNAGFPFPVVSASSVNANGNGAIVNRFTQASIWTTGTYTISGAAQSTYLRNLSYQLSDLTIDQLIAPVPANAKGNPDAYTQLTSNKDTANGTDILDNDKTVSNFDFGSIFSQDIFQTAALAESTGRCYTSQTNGMITVTFSGRTETLPCTGGNTIPPGATGLVFADSSLTIPELGKPTGPPSGSAYDAQPVLLVTNGNITVNTLYGLVYSPGTITISGNSTVIGTLYSASKTGDSQGNGIITNGATQIIYRPMGGNAVDSTGKPIGYSLKSLIKRSVINGSWKDW